MDNVTPSTPVVVGAPLPAVVESPTSRIAELLPELPSYMEDLLPNLKDDKELGIGSKFSAEQKAAFVRKYVETGGRFVASCAVLGCAPVEVYRKLAVDEDWQHALRVAKLNMGEEIAAVSMEVAKTPTGTTDRMAQLKRFFPKVYRNQEQTPSIAVQINLDGGRSA